MGVVLITGASSVIGAHLAIRLIQAAALHLRSSARRRAIAVSSSTAVSAETATQPRQADDEVPAVITGLVRLDEWMAQGSAARS